MARRIWRNEKPLVHIYDIDVKGGILLLEALSVVGSLISSTESTPDLNTKFIILLGRFGSDDGETREDLSGNGGVVSFKRHYIYVTIQNFKLRSPK
jgi:hypothetical protein